jgi:hypothetical protein
MRAPSGRWAELILSKLDLIEDQEITEMAVLDELTTEVGNNGTVIDSALVLINGIADRVAATAGPDITPAVAALVADLKAKDAVLAAAVAANTPPVVTPAPVPPTV